MQDRLKKTYITFLAPAGVGFVAVYLFGQYGQPICLSEQHITVIAPGIFILTAFLAIAGPILYRSLFAHRQRHLHRVPQTVLFKFERNLTGMALVTPYLAMVAYFLQLPRFHLGATVLMALYAIYYYYPSQKRLAFDRQIYRTGDGMTADRMHTHDG